MMLCCFSFQAAIHSFEKCYYIIPVFFVFTLLCNNQIRSRMQRKYIDGRFYVKLPKNVCAEMMDEEKNRHNVVL